MAVLPTYTDKFGECLTEVYDLLFGEVPEVGEPTTAYYGLQLAQQKETLKYREPLIEQFLEQMKALLPDGGWLIHCLPEKTYGNNRFILIDNFLNYYSATAEKKCITFPAGTGGSIAVPQGLTCNKLSCCSREDSWKHGKHISTPCPTVTIPMSDGLITSIKKLTSIEIEHIRYSSSDTRIPVLFITGTILEAYRAHARTEYLLYQQAKKLEEARATNKMLEARLSVLEAFLAPKPSPPKEIDLLGLNVAEIAIPPPQLIVSETC